MAKTEIKISAGTQLELKFTQGATVFVIEDTRRSQLHDTSFYYPTEPAVELKAIQKLTQDILDYGLDDSDVNGTFSEFRDRVVEARKREIEFYKVIDVIRDTIGEMDVEGRKMGFQSKRLKTIESFIIATAEDAYTQPTE